MMLISLSGCGLSNGTTTNEGEQTYVTEDFTMKLYIDEKNIDVTWLDNESVKDLMSKAPFTVNMERYGGFEQVGSLGKEIVSEDVQMTTSPGDIVLYDSDNIVVFFGTNSWRYTKLGHINMNQEELRDLLDKNSVILKLINE